MLNHNITMFIIIILFGLVSVHGLALDRRIPSLSSSGPDLFIRFPITPAQNQSHTRRAPYAYPLYNSTWTHHEPHSNLKRSPTRTDSGLKDTPTPAPTGDPDVLTTVHINDEQGFALLLPKTPHGEFIVLRAFLAHTPPAGIPVFNCADQYHFL